MWNFWIKTLGCKVNQVEGAYIVERLYKKGFKLAREEKEAQIFILNSCAVTEKAYKEALKILRHWKSLSPKVVIFTGCAAQVYAEKIREFAKTLQFPSFYILGQDEKFVIEKFLTNLQESIHIEVSPIPKSCPSLFLENFYGHSRAFVKIQDGCSSYCSYCIVPYTRGPSRSISKKDILKQIEIFLKQGYKEIVLTGIHMGMWGRDLKPVENLVSLLSEIEKVFNKFGTALNLRLSSLEINEIDEEFISFAQESKYLCSHFHIPLQSGSNLILKKMNRKYTAEEYLEKLLRLAYLFPKATFGADVIVGFPGEGEKEFMETYHLLQQSPINWLHCFSFSARPGTPAEKLEPKVPSKIIKKRITLLKVLHNQKRKDFLTKNLGSHRKTILEEDFGDYIKGLTDNYIQVLIKKSEALSSQKGKLIFAELFSLNGNWMLAKPLKEH